MWSSAGSDVYTGSDWLNEHYPDWESLSAYWDVE